MVCTREDCLTVLTVQCLRVKTTVYALIAANSYQIVDGCHVLCQGRRSKRGSSAHLVIMTLNQSKVCKPQHRSRRCAQTAHSIHMAQLVFPFLNPSLARRACPRTVAPRILPRHRPDDFRRVRRWVSTMPNSPTSSYANPFARSFAESVTRRFTARISAFIPKDSLTRSAPSEDVRYVLY
jgi:hypothetical protein